MEKKSIDLFGTNLFKENEVEALKTLANFFHFYKVDLFMVGGCVRDALLNKTPKDIDLCTNATPDQVKKMIDDIGCFKYWDSGIKHGTLTLTSSEYKVSFEITTFRNETEADYSDHRHIENITFSQTLEEDLKRRDLTINSFAYDILNKELNMLDASYLQDLELGIIRAVGDPKERFKEDALRMLRTLRFAAQLGFSIEEETWLAIQELAPTIGYISKERIRDELTKILLSNHPEMIDLVRVSGLSKYCFSENANPGWDFMQALFNLKQNNKHHYTDVWHHTLDVLKRVPADFELRWAALFHDLGKLDTAAVGDDGYDHYINHPVWSCIRAMKHMKLLKFTNDQMEHIHTLIKYHDTELYDIKMSNFKKLVNNISIELFPKFLELRRADGSAHNLDNGDKRFIQAISKAKERFKVILTSKDAMTLKDLAVNGHDMINLGLKDKQIGEALNKCLEDVLEYPEHNTFDYLISLAKE